MSAEKEVTIEVETRGDDVSLNLIPFKIGQPTKRNEMFVIPLGEKPEVIRGLLLDYARLIVSENQTNLDGMAATINVAKKKAGAK